MSISYILIEGIEMPKNCYNCWLGHKCPKYEELLWNEIDKERKRDCPLVPVPPHGRLIDADALLRTMFSSDDGRLYPDSNSDGFPYAMRFEDIRKFLQAAPTIIPAEEG